MRFAAAGALAVLALAAAPASAAPRTVIAFLPTGPGEARPLLDDFAARGMAIGMTSPTVGGFKPRQMGLDMSQGARIPTRLYSKQIGALRLRGGRLTDWGVALRRARRAPGDLRPGLLASTIEAAGMRVGYEAAAATAPSVAPIVAADGSGRVRPARRGDALDVVTLPAGARGLQALDRLLRQRPDFLFVVEEPSGTKLHLLPTGVAARGIRGQLRSATTRRNGLIAATDVAPTVLRTLGLKVPNPMQGEPIEARGTADAAAVRQMADRLEVISGRRGVALEWLAGAWVVTFALAWIAGARGLAVRIALLALLWVPGVALLTAALRPSRTAEAAILGIGSVLLAVASDLAASAGVGSSGPRAGSGTRVAFSVRPFAAPAFAAAVVFAAHAVDLVRGSPLIGASLAGPNPAGGARFFGIGNELETILSVSALLGAGAALSLIESDEQLAVRAERHSRRAPLAFALGAVAAAAVMGVGRLGADVGAVITLGAGGAAAVLASLPTTPSRRAVALAVAAPLLAVLALVALDLATGGNGHLTRSVVHAHDSNNLTDIVRRRFDTSFANLKKPGGAAAFAVALVVLVWLATRLRRLFAAGQRPFAAGLVGAWFATVAGALGNDSGPLILEIGVIYVLAAYAYTRPAIRPVAAPPD